MRKIALLMLVAISMSACGFTVVETGERGVKTTYGKVDGSALTEGLQFYRPWSQDIVRMNIQTQKWQHTTSAYTADVQTANIDFTLNYNLDPNPKYVADVYRTVGVGWAKVLLPQVVYQSIKDVVGQWNAVDLISHRDKATRDIQTEITQRLAKDHIIVTGFNINDIEYDKSFENAVEAKVVAAQNAQMEKNRTVQIQEQADQKIIKAKAEAESMAIRGKALAQNKSLVRWEAVKKWDGHMPQYMLGGGALPFINIKAGAH